MDSHPKVADETPEVLPVGGGQQPPDASPSKAQLLEVLGLLSRQLLDGGNSNYRLEFFIPKFWGEMIQSDLRMFLEDVLKETTN